MHVDEPWMLRHEARHEPRRLREVDSERLGEVSRRKFGMTDYRVWTKNDLQEGVQARATGISAKTPVDGNGGMVSSRDN